MKKLVKCDLGKTMIREPTNLQEMLMMMKDNHEDLKKKIICEDENRD